MTRRRLVCALAVLTVFLVTGAARAAGRDPLDQGQPWQSAYPLVVGVDATPNPTCRGPVRLRFEVYDPPAVGRRLEWRVSIGANAYRMGRTKMTSRLTSVALSIPFADVPAADTPMDIEARIVPGRFGRVWYDHLARSCKPVTVAALGDSIAWGQGLDHEMKMGDVLAQTLGQETGRSYRSLNYAISGAVLDAPAFPPGNDGSRCGAFSYRQDPNGDGQMEFGEVTQQTPDVYCQVEKAKAEAVAGHYKIDLVVLTGCINDLDPLLGLPYGITPGSEDLVAAVRRECSGAGAAATNPARTVPYFSGAKLGYGGRGMKGLLLRIHRALPGHPKVVLASFYWGLSEFTRDRAAAACRVLPLRTRAICRGIAQGIAVPERWDQYARYSGEAYRDAAQQANAASPDGAFAVASDGRFTKRNAFLAPDALVWSRLSGDPAQALREYACQELSATPLQCLTAEIVHPNVAGERQYGETFALLPQVQRWFGTKPAAAPTASFTTSSRTGTPPFPVGFDASATHRVRPIASYHWYFGDGTDAVTSSPTVSHVYEDPGPFRPELLVTDTVGERAFAQAAAPIVANDVPRIPAAFSAVKGSATIAHATVSFDLAQRGPVPMLMSGSITIASPATGSIRAIASARVEPGSDPKTQIESTAHGVANGRPFDIAWSYTATSGGGRLALDLTGGIAAHIEGDVGIAIAPVVRNYYEILADLRP